MSHLQLLRNVEPRLYQEVIYKEALHQNTLVVLPTGLGKTVIIAYLVAHYLQKQEDGLIMVATPTKPLVHQTVGRLHDFIACSPEKIVGVSGSIVPNKRVKMYEDARVIVGTPQTLNNDLLAGRINSEKVIFLALDEVHRATGNYAYVGIVQQLPLHVHVVGFTATPGNTKEQVLEVIQNIRAEHVVVKDESDPDVRPYVSIHRPERVFVDLPSEYRQALSLLERYQKDLIRTMEEIINEHGLEDPVIQGYLRMNASSRKTALELHHHVINLMREQPEWGNLLTSTANLLRVAHLQDLIETQGLPQAATWLNSQEKKSRSKALQEFFDHQDIIKLIQILKEKATPHPKLSRLKTLIDEHLIPTESKIIVFSNYRDTVEFLHDELLKFGYNVAKFIGQSSRNDHKGMSQKEQVSTLSEFQSGSIDVLVSTSVGEEGLDVGNCDLVVFYDSVPSVIRSIQRTGRGRKKKSRVVHLIAKGTRDVGMYYSTKSKNKKIQLFLRIELPKMLKSKKTSRKMRNLDQWVKNESSSPSIKVDDNNLNVKSTLIPTSSSTIAKKGSPSASERARSLKIRHDQVELDKSRKETRLGNSFRSESELRTENSTASALLVSDNDEEPFHPLDSLGSLRIVVDNRESASVVPRLLKRRGITISMEALPVGDYFIPPSVLVERKTHEDFVASIYDGRLFSQAAEMAKQHEIDFCFLILEENRNSGTSLRIEAEHGAILSLLLDFNVIVIISRAPAETVDYLVSLVKRFQVSKNKRTTIPLRSTASLSLQEIRELMLMQITGINKTKAKNIMNHFKTLESVFMASVDELEQVEGIGKVLARRIYEVLHGTDNSQE